MQYTFVWTRIAAKQIKGLLYCWNVCQCIKYIEKYVKLFTLKVGSIPTLFQQHQKKWKMKVLDECPQEQDESSAVKDDI